LVEVMHTQRSDYLTAAFRNPRLLSQYSSFVAANQSFILSSRASGDLVLPRQAILIGLQTNRAAVVWVILGCCLVSILVCVVIGAYGGRWDLGLAASTGLIGVVSVVEIVLFLNRE
jgi:hypothetical protein